MVTTVFLENSFKISQDFRNASSRYFLSNIYGLNFRKDLEGSRKGINSWVEGNTNNKINNVFLKGSLPPDTRLALVNAIYFKAKWLHQFNEKKTKVAPFYMTPNKTVNVSMMSLSEKVLHYKHCTSLQANVLELPFQVKDYRMVLILPHDYDGLSNVESKMVSSNLFSQLRGLTALRVNLELPKFKLEKQMDLEKILRKLGMPKAFSFLAEFYKISNETLKIDKMVQKALLEVNEEGTEATAPIVGKFDPSMPIVQKITFDHPLHVSSYERLDYPVHGKAFKSFYVVCYPI